MISTISFGTTVGAKSANLTPNLLYLCQGLYFRFAGFHFSQQESAKELSKRERKGGGGEREGDGSLTR